MIETKVISGFPGVGKSVLTSKTNLRVLDSDSSKFSWIEEGVRNPDFPNNYMDRIKEEIDNVDYIFVSSHEVVRDALKAQGIPYTIVYPSIELKDEYLKRYANRGSDSKFIEFIDSNWDQFIQDIENDDYPDHIVLGRGEYLADKL